MECLPVRREPVPRAKATTMPSNGDGVFARSNALEDQNRQWDIDSVNLLIIDVDDVEVAVLWRYGSSIDHLRRRHLV